MLSPSVEAAVRRLVADLSGPITVVGRRPGDDGCTSCDVRALWLVPVDPSDLGPERLHVGVPVEGTVQLSANGELRSASIAAPPEEVVAEARVFAQDLVASGRVHGVAPRGPQGYGRPTHTVRVDHAGRRVIERTGFDGAGPSTGDPSHI